jgi:bifunctional non-homologous end joining protein LigD
MSLPVFWPAPLQRVPAPFSHPDWLFEIKWDGFRALAHIEEGHCRLLSRNRNEFKSFSALKFMLPHEFRGRSAILDGELVCLDGEGKPNFRDLLFRRGEPRFIAFDILWNDGEDLRRLPLIERKDRLRGMVPIGSDQLRYCDHIEGDGHGLFRLACEHDLEGIVAKRKFDPYSSKKSDWLKIRNSQYSQWINREELFERERESEPNFAHWNECVLACEDQTELFEMGNP